MSLETGRTAFSPGLLLRECDSKAFLKAKWSEQREADGRVPKSEVSGDCAWRPEISVDFGFSLVRRRRGGHVDHALGLIVIGPRTRHIPHA